MKNWKIIIEHEGRVLELAVEKKYYSEAYIYAEVTYPGCVIRSIAEIRP